MVTHHGRAIMVTTDRPMSRPIPEVAASETSTQPHGRSPASRHIAPSWPPVARDLLSGTSR